MTDGMSGSGAWRLPKRGSIAAARIEEMLELLESVSEPKARARLLYEVGTGLRDDLGDESQALDALAEAFAADPRYEPILDALEPLVTSQGRWAQILESTRQLAQGERDSERAVALSETMVR